MDGYEDNTFRPDNAITRAELSAMIARYLNSIGHTLPNDPSALERFADADSVPDWAGESMAAMVSLGIVNGYENGTIGAARSATRAEAVTMLLRAADLPAPTPDEEAPVPDESPEPRQ
ncbi:MAG: S-layer homology domain-containing protein [Oscillospiraceae bacterium]|nr:S-layer homology domain-containing protein [Oscillospiraceae bacterium]